VIDSDSRGQKALALVASGALDEAHYVERSSTVRLVPSQSKDGAFYLADATCCTCADRKYRNTICKHMQAIRVINLLKCAAQTNRQTLEAVQA